MLAIAYCEFDWPHGCEHRATHIILHGYAKIYYCETHFNVRKDEFLTNDLSFLWPKIRYR